MYLEKTGKMPVLPGTLMNNPVLQGFAPDRQFQLQADSRKIRTNIPGEKFTHRRMYSCQTAEYLTAPPPSR